MIFVRMLRSVLFFYLMVGLSAVVCVCLVHFLEGK